MDYMKVLHNTLSQNVQRKDEEKSKKESGNSTQQNQTDLNQDNLKQADDLYGNSLSLSETAKAAQEEKKEEAVKEENKTIKNNVLNTLLNSLVKNVKAETVVVQDVVKEDVNKIFVKEEIKEEPKQEEPTVSMSVPQEPEEEEKPVAKSSLSAVLKSISKPVTTEEPKEMTMMKYAVPDIPVEPEDPGISVDPEKIPGGQMLKYAVPVLPDPVIDPTPYKPLPDPTVDIVKNPDGSTTTVTTYYDGNWSSIVRDVDGNVISQEGGFTIKAGSTLGQRNTFRLDGFDVPFDVEISNPSGADAKITYSINANGEVILNASNMDIKAQKETMYILYKNYETKEVTEYPLNKLTIVGDNNTITGSNKDDNITVKGNNNKVDLGAGEDSLAIKGDNNTIKNVEDLTTATWIVPAGEKGSIEWINKLLGSDLQIANPQYDDAGRLVSFDLGVKEGIKLYTGVNTSYTISYNDWGTDIVCTTTKNINILINEQTNELNDPNSLVYKPRFETTVTTVTTKSFNANDEFESERTSKLDKNGNEIFYSSKDKWGGGYECSSIYENGLLVSRKSQYTQDGVLTATYEDSYQYDEFGRTIISDFKDFDAEGNMTYHYVGQNEYFENGNFAKTNYSYEYADGSIYKGASTYFENGNVKEIVNTQYDADGLRTRESVSNYDEKGGFVSESVNMAVKSGETCYANNLRLTNNNKDVATVSYTLDADGKMVLDASGFDIKAEERVYLDYLNQQYVLDDGTVIENKRQAILGKDSIDVTAGGNAEIETGIGDDVIIEYPYTPISPKYWAPAMENLTINGNNNNIQGSWGDDNISVNGNNNNVDLGKGDDTLNIVGNNNKIKNVETVTMNQTTPPPTPIKPGALGSVEYIGKLLGQEFSPDMFDVETDEQGRATYLRYKGKTIILDNGLSISSKPVLDRGFYISYGDNDEVSITPFNGNVGGSETTTTYNADAQVIKETVTQYGMLRQETHYNYDGDRLWIKESASYDYKSGELSNWEYTTIDEDGSSCTRIKSDYTDGQPQKDTLTGYDANGNVNYTVVDVFKGDESPIVGGWGPDNAQITLSNENILLVAKGDKAVINEDGTVEVSRADGTVQKFDKDGNEIVEPSEYKGVNVTSLDGKDHDIAISEDEQSVTVDDVVISLIPAKMDVSSLDGDHSTVLDPMNPHKITVDDVVVEFKADMVYIDTLNAKDAKVEQTDNEHVIINGVKISFTRPAMSVDSTKDKDAEISFNDNNTVTVNGVDISFNEVKKYYESEKPVIKPGAVGSIEFAEKITGIAIQEMQNVQYDSEDRVVAFQIGKPNQYSTNYTLSYDANGIITVKNSSTPSYSGEFVPIPRVRKFDKDGNVIQGDYYSEAYTEKHDDVDYSQQLIPQADSTGKIIGYRKIGDLNTLYDENGNVIS